MRKAGKVTDGGEGGLKKKGERWVAPGRVARKILPLHSNSLRRPGRFCFPFRSNAAKRHLILWMAKFHERITCAYVLRRYDLVIAPFSEPSRIQVAHRIAAPSHWILGYAKVIVFSRSILVVSPAPLYHRFFHPPKKFINHFSIAETNCHFRSAGQACFLH